MMNTICTVICCRFVRNSGPQIQGRSRRIWRPNLIYN